MEYICPNNVRRDSVGLIDSGMVDREESQDAVIAAVDAFLADVARRDAPRRR